MPNYLNRFPVSLVPAQGTTASLKTSTAYPQAAGELAFATDAQQLYVGVDPTTAGSFCAVPTETARLNLTARTTSLAPTVLHTPSTAGLFRLSYYLLITATDASATLTLTAGWTDDNGMQSLNLVNAMSMASVAYVQGQMILRAMASSNITYAVTLAGITGSPSFSLYAMLERLW